MPVVMRLLAHKRVIWLLGALLAAAVAVVGYARLRRTSYFRVRFGEAAERAKAVRELADKPARLAAGSLLAALRDSDSNVRALAVRALAGFRLAQAPAPCRRMTVEDPDAEVRTMAAGLLGEVQAPENAAVLVRALSDPSENVRAAAAAALAKLQAHDAAPDLIARLDDDAETVRAEAVM